jgi:hypothetical protein
VTSAGTAKIKLLVGVLEKKNTGNFILNLIRTTKNLKNREQQQNTSFPVFNSATRASRRPPSRPVRRREAPSRRKRTAVERPMPDEAPV